MSSCGESVRGGCPPLPSSGQCRAGWSRGSSGERPHPIPCVGFQPGCRCVLSDLAVAIPLPMVQSLLECRLRHASMPPFGRQSVSNPDPWIPDKSRDISFSQLPERNSRGPWDATAIALNGYVPQDRSGASRRGRVGLSCFVSSLADESRPIPASIPCTVRPRLLIQDSGLPTGNNRWTACLARLPTELGALARRPCTVSYLLFRSSCNKAFPSTASRFARPRTQ
jgi:hypothetical protein